MPTVIPNFATILSVFPVAMEQMRRHNGCIAYKHPAAPKDSILVRTYNPEILANTNRVPEDVKLFHDEGRECEVGRGYALIRFPDTFTWTRDFTQDKEIFMPHPIPCHLVATDLHQGWASDAILADGGAGPGMLVLKADEPTDEEVEFVRNKQTVYFRRLINEAHALHSKGNQKDISDLHRAGANWMGAKNLAWLPKIEQVDMKQCIGCGNEIRKVALRCEKCNIDLPEFYLKWNMQPEQKDDPVVYELLQKILTNRKSKVA